MDKPGFIFGLVSAATFGLIPLFTLPLLRMGVTIESALVYRFTIASLIIGLIMAWQKENFAIGIVPVLKIMLLSIFYLFAVLFFFQGFLYLPSGIVATIQFLYPVLVMLIMILFFHEKFSWRVCCSVILALTGVGLLSIDLNSQSCLGDNENNILWGVVFSLLAALGNALYFVGIQVAKLPRINGMTMTFYVMVFGTLISGSHGLCKGTLQWLASFNELFLVSGLAIVTAVISNLALILAIKRIGSTMAAILGVFEPVTAVMVGLFVFNEPFGLQLAIGLLLIILAVILTLLGKQNQIKTKKAGND